MTFQMPEILRPILLHTLIGQVANARAPDFIIGPADDPYLRRWWVTPRGQGPATYLHHFLRSDDDRALHDHPWASVSILLDGSYREHGPDGAEMRNPGDVLVRAPEAAHRVELLTDAAGRPMPVWTLFLVGHRVRDWGFLCPQGWTPWQEFCAVTEDGRNAGTVGRGCG